MSIFFSEDPSKPIDLNMIDRMVADTELNFLVECIHSFIDASF